MNLWRTLPAIVCLALGWGATPLLPRAWGLGPVHGLFAGTALYYVAFVRAPAPRGSPGRRSIPGAAPLRSPWQVALARAAVFGAVLAVLLLVVFELYRGFDVRWHLATFAAWAISEDLAERFHASRAPEP
ncbi:MAG TPA: hypothetical protein VID50_09695 [Candidatus Eisenbacteria bacterium]|jgi:hypothetical protein